MGITRLIVIVAVIWLIWFILTRFQQRQLEKKKAKKTETPLSNVKKCQVCGIYVPEREALAHNGRYYCSEAHKSADTSFPK